MLVSVVVPMYNEEDNIIKFYETLTATMDSTSYAYEMVFVDDGSSDDTAYILSRLAESDKRVKSILLARNFGHQKALTCGMDYARGDVVITMDSDMQHPPAMIPELLSYWEEGYEVVQTIRKTTEKASLFKNISSALYYKLLNTISEVSIVEGGSDFRLLDRKALNTLLRFREKGRFLRGIVGGLGYKRKDVEFIAPPRYAGRSKYNLRRMLHFALDGVAAHSKIPLRVAFYTGLCVGLFSLLFIFHILYVYFFTDGVVDGWSTLAVAILLLGGIELIGIGVLGEYIGRVFEEVKNRPLYWVRDAINCEDREDK